MCRKREQVSRRISPMQDCGGKFISLEKQRLPLADFRTSLVQNPHKFTAAKLAMLRRKVFSGKMRMNYWPAPA
jgi:hypothetical protein